MASCAEIERRIEIGHIGSEILPSLSSLDVTVDLRLRLRAGKPDIAVPIAIFHVDTDSYNQEVWFQATKADVERMQKQLKEILERMESAEQWASR